MGSRTWEPTRRRWGALGLVVVLALSLAACGGDGDDAAEDPTSAETQETETTAPAEETESETETEATDDGASAWDEIVAAAEEEGALTLYASGGVVEAMVEAFEQTYPSIDVELLAAPTTDLAARLDAEFQSGNVQADALYFAFPGWIAENAAAGRFAEPAGPAAADYPAQAMDNGAINIAGDPYGLIWNTSLVTDVPEELAWDSFIDPQYDGLIVWIEPISPIIATLMCFQENENPGGGFYTEQIVPLNPQISSSGSANHQAVGAGEAAWSPHGISSFSNSLKADGAPVDFRVPGGPVFAIAYSSMVLADAPHPNAGQVFLNWLMSEEGQQVIVDAGQALSFRAAGNPDFKPTGALDVTIDEVNFAGPDDPSEECAALVDEIVTSSR